MTLYLYEYNRVLYSSSHALFCTALSRSVQGDICITRYDGFFRKLIPNGSVESSMAGEQTALLAHLCYIRSALVAVAISVLATG